MLVEYFTLTRDLRLSKCGCIKVLNPQFFIIKLKKHLLSSALALSEPDYLLGFWSSTTGSVSLLFMSSLCVRSQAVAVVNLLLSFHFNTCYAEKWVRMYAFHQAHVSLTPLGNSLYQVVTWKVKIVLAETVMITWCRIVPGIVFILIDVLIQLQGTSCALVSECESVPLAN